MDFETAKEKLRTTDSGGAPKERIQLLQDRVEFLTFCKRYKLRGNLNKVITDQIADYAQKINEIK